MKKFDVQVQLERVREDRAAWKKAFNTFNLNVNKVIVRLLHEAAVNRMSAEEFATHSGMRLSEVRKKMRNAGLDPKAGKILLAKTAAEALASNAELLGMAPHEMDLMSPLAYLPAGQELRQALTDATTHPVHELLEDQMYQAILLRFEGMGEAWTTDSSGDTLARAAAEEAARLVSGNPS